MNQEQFKAFWTQLKAPLKAKWEKITDVDILEIEGNLATFTAVLANDMAQPRMAKSIPGPTDAIPIGQGTIRVHMRIR